MAKKSHFKNIQEQDLVSLDGILEILKNKKKLFWLNFKAGFTRGFAGILGAALAILFVGFLDFIKQIGDAVKTAK